MKFTLLGLALAGALLALAIAVSVVVCPGCEHQHCVAYLRTPLEKICVNWIGH